MKELLVSFFLALVVGSVINGCLQPPVQPSQSPDTSESTTAPGEGAIASLVTDTSDDTFRVDVLNSATPVLVDFWAQWCGPCKAMMPVVNQVSLDYARQLKVVRVDVDSNEELTNQYRISALPTFMVFKDGQPLESFSGATSKADLETRLSRYLAPQAAVR